MGSETGSSVIPILIPTWTRLDLQNAEGNWKLWISGYTLDQWVGGGEVRIPLNCVSMMQYTCKDHLVCSLPSKKPLLRQRKRKQFRYRTCSNSLNDGAWWVAVLKVPNEGAKVLQLLHTLTRKIYFCLPIYIYDLSQVNMPGLFCNSFMQTVCYMHCGFRCAIICTMVYSQVCL